MDDTLEFGKPIKRKTPLNPVDSYLTGSWEALGNGAPVLVALAQIASQAMITQPTPSLEKLAPEAKAILVAARNRGVIEIKAVNSAFEAPSRMLAVYVELDEDRTIAFRDPLRPEVTVSFLSGFQELCEQGMVMHHMHRDFSLTKLGFEIAKGLLQKDVQPWLDKGTDFGLHD